MAIVHTDHEIASLLCECKPLPTSWQHETKLVAKSGHKENQLDVQGEDGTAFRLILRQSTLNVLDFSIILASLDSKSNRVFRLRRYNGKSHEHTNRIEQDTFYDFHIYKATERYQELGEREDGYAEPTDRYESFQGALACLIEDAYFKFPVEPQGSLF